MKCKIYDERHPFFLKDAIIIDGFSDIGEVRDCFDERFQVIPCDESVDEKTDFNCYLDFARYILENFFVGNSYGVKKDFLRELNIYNECFMESVDFRTPGLAIIKLPTEEYIKYLWTVDPKTEEFVLGKEVS